MLRLDYQRVVRARGVDTLVFDLDGTLVEHNINYGEGRRRVVERIRKSLPDLFRRLPKGLSLERMRAYEIISLAESLSWEVANKARSIVYEEYEGVELEAVEKACLRPGVAEAVRELKQRGYKLGIVTNNARRPVDKLLSRFPILRRADVVVTRDDAKALKPDPGGVLMALSLMGSRPLTSLMAGDSIIDVITARRAGVIPIGVRGGVSSAHELYKAGAYTIVDGVPELTKRLEREATL